MKKIQEDTFRLFLLATACIILVFIIISFDRKEARSSVNINSFEDCVKAGYPVLESYPEQCMAPDGTIFVRVVQNEL